MLLNNNANISAIVEGVKDIGGEGLVADMKAKMADAINLASADGSAMFNEMKMDLVGALQRKGRNVSASSTFTELASEIDNIVLGQRMASGTGVTLPTGASYVFDNNSTGTYGVAAVSGLSFQPSVVIIQWENAGWKNLTFVSRNRLTNSVHADTRINAERTLIRLTGNAALSNNGFTLPVLASSYSTPFTWEAFE